MMMAVRMTLRFASVFPRKVSALSFPGEHLERRGLICLR